MNASLKPKALRKGDVIGLVAPAGAVWDRERIERAVRYLEAQGYRVEVGANARSNDGAFSGTDEQRAADLNAMLRDSRVRAVFALRGGYGTPRILDRIDYAAVRRDPKIVVGYSDITALQLALYRKTGLVTFSGPLAAVELAGSPDLFTEEHFWRVLTSRKALGKFPVPDEDPVVAGNPGTGEGVLLGGCLSLVTAMMGTPYLPSLKGALLVFEDVHESFHRVDRMLTQLRLGGVFEKSAGIVFGKFTKMAAADPAHPFHELPPIIATVLHGIDRPTLFNFPYGHVPRKATVPWGVRARLDAKRGALTLLEGAVV
jgi:muramoyltetrapeptide carboxypeptidase